MPLYVYCGELLNGYAPFATFLPVITEYQWLIKKRFYVVHVKNDISGMQKFVQPISKACPRMYHWQSIQYHCKSNHGSCFSLWLEYFFIGTLLGQKSRIELIFCLKQMNPTSRTRIAFNRIDSASRSNNDIKCNLP